MATEQIARREGRETWAHGAPNGMDAALPINLCGVAKARGRTWKRDAKADADVAGIESCRHTSNLSGQRPATIPTSTIPISEPPIALTRENNRVRRSSVAMSLSHNHSDTPTLPLRFGTQNQRSLDHDQQSDNATSASGISQSAQ